MQQFYWLDRSTQEHELLRTEYFTSGSVNHGEAVHCPHCGRCISQLRWLPPYSVEIATAGKGFADIAFSGGHSILVSERLAALFRMESLTGLSGFELVEVVRVRKRRTFVGEPPHYFHVEVARSRAAIDVVTSGYEFDGERPCPECRMARIVKRWQRVVFEPETWSGEDIFLPRGPGGIFCTTRFKDFCERHQVTGASLLPAEQYSRDFYPWERTRENR